MQTLHLYQDQIKRIKTKLLSAKTVDTNLKVFGANRHKYYLSETISFEEVISFERKYSVQLPECYKSFVLQVGNGGKSYADSGAGPFYGIYPFGKNVDELLYEDAARCLGKDCILYPKMTDEYWKSLTGKVENVNLSDKRYEDDLGTVFSGLLPIASQGCTYLSAIVLNGEHKGRIVNLDIDMQKPSFAFESNFLDWYERWLDEVISRELIKDTPTWFGYLMGGAEEELLNLYIESETDDVKNDSLKGLLDKSLLRKETLDQVEKLIIANSKGKGHLIQILCKSNYSKAKPYLLELISSDMLTVFQSIFWYAKDKSDEWIINITENIRRIEDYETFRFCCYILERSTYDYGYLLVPFTKNDNENIRIQAYYALGKLKNKKEYLPTFIEGLSDNSSCVVHSTLQALSDLKDERLLKHYQDVAQRFPTEQNYVLVNLGHRLAEYGLTRSTILNKRFDEGTYNEPVKKRWYEIWK
jgi:hypothetical protein